MYVSRVELENIKAFENAEFTFEKGVTAIMGQNGAGKTTILEAVAWALFDTLEYSKEDFLRRGAKKGWVRVNFESDLDQRVYTVYRDTNNGYYIYDPALGIKLAEKKTDVSGFLRSHLGIDPGADLKALYRSAIGVPQGSFTTEFVLPANARKASFDRLLKVEEYREGAERLRDTVGLVREQSTEVREELAAIEGQLSRLPSLTEERRLTRQRIAEVEQLLNSTLVEVENGTKRLRTLDELAQKVQDATSHFNKLSTQYQLIEERLQVAEKNFNRSRAAAEILVRTEFDHKTYLEALKSQESLDLQQRERDKLRSSLDEITRRSIALQVSIGQQEEALRASKEALIEMRRLENDIKEQDRIESLREQLREKRASAMAAASRVTAIEKELEQLRATHGTLRQRIKEAEIARERAGSLTQLETERKELEEKLSAVRESVVAASHLKKEQDELKREIKRLESSIATLQKDSDELKSATLAAANLLDLEQTEKSLSEQLANLRAQIKRDEQMQREVKGGLCPILSQRCLNLSEGQTLEHYFTDQLSTFRNELVTLEKRSAGLSGELLKAREAEKRAARFSDIKERLLEEEQLMQTRKRQLSAVDEDLKRFSVDKKSIEELQSEVLKKERELTEVRSLALKYAELPALQDRRQEIEDEGRRKRAEFDEFSAIAGAVASIDIEIKGLDQLLQQLNDPKGRHRTLNEIASKEEELKEKLSASQAGYKVIEREIQDKNEKLSQFSELDKLWAENSQIRERTLKGHNEYLSAQSEASHVEERREQFTSLSSETKQLRSELDLALVSLRSATDSYSAQEHEAHKDLVIKARDRAVSLDTQRTMLRDREAELENQIVELDSLRSALHEGHRKKDELEQVNQTVEFIRDILKQAGPLVTESYLYNISVEANHLFREISGNVGRTLKWSRDYEIRLEEEGYERPFANLSGGEQMTAALSIRLALLKQLSDIRLAIFDEPTVNMDAERRERLAESIGKVKDFDQLFVISHDDSFEEYVDQVVFVTRDQ